MVVRFRFYKHGAVKYIGHLDVMRYFQKAIRRAELDICYTEGFSPHQIITFAQPLGVGIESDGEYVDLKLHSMNSLEDLVSRFNKSSVPEIQVVDACLLPENAVNAMSSIAAAEYRVYFREGRIPNCILGSDGTVSETDICALVDEYNSKEEIPYTKTTKKGTRDLNLKDGLFGLRWESENKCLWMLLDATSGNTIKPAQILETMFALRSDSLLERAVTLRRVDLYTRKSTEGDSLGELISMIEVGTK